MRSFLAALALASAIALACAPTDAFASDDACGTADFAAAARRNEAARDTLRVAPFGRAERGWIIYEPQIARAIGSDCAGDSAGFAAALAVWQSTHGLKADGVVDATTLSVLKSSWQNARLFVGKRRGCPPPPRDADLGEAAASEIWGGKRSQLEARALAALRRMVAAAKQDPAIAGDVQALRIVSAYRSPSYDAARCARDGNCNGVARARCSAHRTGKAVDLFVGAAPGQSPVSSNDANRVYQSRTPTYRWLVANAARFGFVNYVFEPWHWEWTDEEPELASTGPNARAR